MIRIRIYHIRLDRLSLDLLPKQCNEDCNVHDGPWYGKLSTPPIHDQAQRGDDAAREHEWEMVFRCDLASCSFLQTTEDEIHEWPGDL